MLRLLLPVILVASVTAQPRTACAADKPPAAASTSQAFAPKTAEEVFDRYLAAVGGRAALEKIKTRTSKGTMDMPTFNVTGKLETYHKAPNSYRSVLVMDTGTVERGFDGTAGWDKNSFAGGLRELEGIELAALKEDAEMHPFLRTKELFPGAQLKGKEKLDNGEAWVVEIPPDGKARTKAAKAWFDAATGLLVRLDKETPGPEGSAPIEIKFSDYREVDGVKIPFAVSMEGAQFAFSLKLDEVKHNLEIADSRFAKPAN